MNKLASISSVAFALIAFLAGANSVFAASATLDKIKSSGAVTMGVRESSIPMSYTTGDSRFDGYHVEICRMILGDIKDKLGMSTLRINYQPVTSQNRVPLVQNGTVDIECGTTTNNTARAKDVGFANTLYVEEVRIAVKANSGIKSIADLNGKKVLVRCDFNVPIDERGNVLDDFKIRQTLPTIKYLLENVNKLDAPIIAVGTTSLRTLESVYWLGVKAFLFFQQHHKNISLNDLNLLQWDAYNLIEHCISVQDALNTLSDLLSANNTDILITKTQLMVTPGYTFKICDALVTNFHQPKSTLLLIVAAIAGEDWKAIYEHAITNKYRFLSYGDGCLFWIRPLVM